MAYDIYSALDLLSKGLVEPDEGDFKIEEIVPLKQFVEDPYYLGLEPLSAVQFDFVDNLTSIYREDSLYTEGVLQCGKSGGKDHMSRIILARTVYKLLNLKDPQHYYGLSKNSNIYTINVSTSGENADNVFFQEYQEIIKNSPYFKKVGVKILNKEIQFPRNIYSLSSNSSVESYEGLNIFTMILDEIDAFKSAEELRGSPAMRSRKSANGIYDRARASTQSRFAGYGKVILLSWPRYKNSFIQQRHKQGLLESSTYVACKIDNTPYATWDINPTKTKEMFADEYLRNREKAEAMYECKPQFAEDMFFKDVAKVLDTFNAIYTSAETLIEANGNIKNAYEDILSGSYAVDGSGAFCIHIDLGLSRCKAAIGIAHKISEKPRDNPTTENVREYESIIRLDAVKYYYPDPETGEISFADIREDIFKIKENYPIFTLTLDHFQSADFIQICRRAGIRSDWLSVDRNTTAYDTLQDLVYIGAVRGFFDETAIYELLRLQKIGGKIYAQNNDPKDAADCIAGAIYGAQISPMNRTEVLGNAGDMVQVITEKAREDAVKSGMFISPPQSGLCPDCAKKLVWFSDDRRDEYILASDFLPNDFVCFVCYRPFEMENSKLKLKGAL